MYIYIYTYIYIYIYILDSTLQNSSEDQLLTILLYVSEKFALDVNKDIIRLTMSYLEASFFSFYLLLFLYVQQGLL